MELWKEGVRGSGRLVGLQVLSSGLRSLYAQVTCLP